MPITGLERFQLGVILTFAEWQEFAELCQQAKHPAVAQLAEVVQKILPKMLALKERQESE